MHLLLSTQSSANYNTGETTPLKCSKKSLGSTSYELDNTVGSPRIDTWLQSTKKSL